MNREKIAAKLLALAKALTSDDQSRPRKAAGRDILRINIESLPEGFGIDATVDGKNFVFIANGPGYWHLIKGLKKHTRLLRNLVEQSEDLSMESTEDD